LLQCRHAKKSTTDGSTWASQVGTIACFLAGFTDGTWYGSPCQTGAYFNTSGVDRAYTGVELGGVMQVPDNVWLNVVGVWGWLRRVADPGALRFKLYSGLSLLGTSLDVPQAQTSTTATTISGYFDRSIIVPPKTILRATFTAAGGDNASNYYYISGLTGETGYPDNKPTPFIYTRIVDGAATDTDGKYPALALLLDGAQPFVQPPINRRQFNSMR